MIPIKDCQFCSQPTLYVPLTTTAINPVSKTRSLRVHFCADCQAEYVIWKDDGSVASIHLYTTINDKMYRWTTGTSIKHARLFYIGQPGIPGKEANKEVEFIQRFDTFPQITPQNIEEKIRFMLPFL
jgi:hypothetical protein